MELAGRPARGSSRFGLCPMNAPGMANSLILLGVLRVRIPLGTPFFSSSYRDVLQACQYFVNIRGAWLRTRWSGVRVPPGAPDFL